jgi:gliding motility-associated-like protein
MKLYRSVFFACLLLLCHAGWAQDFSNKGKDFWLGYGYHVNMGSGVAAGQQNLQDMVLYFTSDKNASVTVEIPGVGYKKAYTVSANQVTTSDPIPKTGAQDARINTVGTFDRGIHITSDVPIVAYAHIYNSSVSGASLLFPTNTLGKDYYSVSYTQSSNATFANGFFFVVATEDNTSVEITPSAANLNGKPANVAFTVTLNAGQIYSVMGTTTGNLGTDLTGSRIRSVSANGSGGCKKIAVFSGSGKMSIGGTGANASGSADNLFAQALPAVAWGKKYLTVPTGTQPNNFYRVCVTDPTTVVKLNGVVIPSSLLQNNFYYQFKNGNAGGTNPAVPNLIESDKPIMVAQYCTTQGVDGNPQNTAIGGDPEMIYLSPVEQTINNITLYSASKFQILQSYINVVIRKEGVASFKLDGVLQAASFAPHPQESNYSYATFTVSAGSHSLYSDSGFNAIAYGFGSAESYGYNAGTNVIDFTKTTAFQNPYNRIDSAVTCTNTPFQFAVPLNFQPASMVWDFSAAPNINPSTNINAAPAYDSISQGLYYYSPHKTFNFSKANTEVARDTIKLYTTSSTPDGCGSTSQLYTIPVKVNETPVAGFGFVHSGCVSDSVQFTDKGIYSGTTGKWLWDYGDGTAETRVTGDPFAKKYANGGSYTIKLKTVADVGCASTEVTQTISIQSKPFAKFNSAALICQNTETSFTDASTSTVGTIVKWIWDLNDGKGGFINTTNAAVKASFDSYGTKHPALQVETSNGCKSDIYDPGVLVNPGPEPGFILPEVCLNDASAQFTDTSKIASGSIVAWSWNMNAGSPAVSPGPSTATSTAQNPQVKYNKSDYYKVSLTATSALGCKATITQDFTVNGSIPKAAFSIANAAPYCGIKPVQLKNNSTVDFGNVTRMEIYWDNTNAPTVKETIETPVSAGIYPHSYSDPTSPKQYTIRMLAYSGGTSCVNETSQTITVYPQPKAAFTVSASSLCSNETVNFTDKSSTGSSAAASWVWDLAKGDVSNVQNPSKQYKDSGSEKTGMYFYNKDGCISDTAYKTLTVYPNPQVTLQHKAVVLEGGVITLKPEWVYGNSLQYLWTPSTYLSSDTALMPKATPQDDITYKLNVTAEGGCTASDTIFIRVLKGPVVPNVFSPNGDGINDTWYIKYLDGYPGATVDVYDRGGQLVYHSVGYDKEWDGTYKGKPLELGTFYYIINPRNGKPTISGSVTIIK